MSPDVVDRPPGARTPLAAVYVVYFSSVGVTLPFLPGYLQQEGLSPSQIGVLLAIQPAVALVAPGLFCAFADRRGEHRRVLAAMGFGATIGFSTLLLANSFIEYAAALAAYAFFATSIVPLVDSLSIEAVRAGGSYSHLRLFGSVGFAITSLSVGIAAGKLDRAVIIVPLVLLVLVGIFALGVGTRLEPGNRAMASRPPLEGGVVPLLAASALHWIACAPFHGSLALHVAALGLPTWVVGAAAAVGVAAEIGVMVLYPRTLQRISERTVLGFAFAASALRWLGMGFADGAAAIVALSVLHGFTFGAFYIAAISLLARTIPVERRARGQGLFGAITFGAGGLVGYAVSGVAFDALGGPRLFQVASGVEVVAAVVALTIPVTRTRA